MNNQELIDIIKTLKELENLKSVTRTAWTQTGRQESTAEHSWRLAIFAMLLKDYFPHANSSKLITMALVHDLGEAYTGDIPATLQSDNEEKLKQETINLQRLLTFLPEKSKEDIFHLIDEYNQGLTYEAKIIKALDKIETITQHNQGNNPNNFDYTFNLTYGKTLSEADPILQILRKIIDQDTKKNISPPQ